MNECKALIVYRDPPLILAMAYLHEKVRAAADAMFAPLFVALGEMANEIASLTG